ncbi:hypothetical protein [Jannaschia sp. W003]|uniref:hypothetical protein n=1 Tax=Jannaschia sp. W003 TaxID=2867012 RepID=UPI0021A7AC0E|nr:hypothetical protein [Jannaschia sp. W003]UWQ20086.1 hypothetical protein K3554_08690 [Jannaschia sp. W003]
MKKYPWATGSDIQGERLSKSLPPGENMRRMLAGKKPLSPEKVFGKLYSLPEAIQALGVDLATIERWREDRQIVVLDSEKRGLIVPVAQFEGGKVLPGVADVLRIASGSATTAWLFLKRPHHAFDGQAPVEALREGRVQEVLEAASLTIR